MFRTLCISSCVILACLSQIAPAQDDDLVIWWKLDETSGNRANDSSGHHTHGYLRGDPAWVTGVSDGGLALDGKNDYVAVSNAYYSRVGLVDVTVCTWIRTSKEEDQVIFSFDRNEYWRLEINGAAGKPGAIGWDVMTDVGQVDLAGRTRVDDGQWHHVAGVFDRGRIAIYVDGQVDATTQAGSTFGTGNRRFGFVGVGSEATGYDGEKAPETYFDGELDDIRLYTRALSIEEIQEIALQNSNNDDCKNATPIGEVEALAFDTMDATHDGPGLFIRSPNIWYRYTAGCTGQATISLCGSQFDTMVAVYAGGDCDPGPDRLLAYNDDFCGYQSEVTINVTAGETYLIEVGGYDQHVGQGVLSITCEGGVDAEHDLGDAPDSAGDDAFMTAYTWLDQDASEAHFPTVFVDSEGRSVGPLHLEPLAVAHLGETVTREDEADSGDDEDSVNNIDPAGDESDLDGGDDGVVFPIAMPHGGWAHIDYIVNVVTPGTDLWVNVWCDFNRDGDWDDSTDTDPDMVCDAGPVSEWAVQNQLLFDLPAGLNHLTAPAFLAWHPAKGPDEIWMRITLSEKPWRGGDNPEGLGNGGSGPAEGYDFGETEDYRFVPEQACTLCQDLNGDGVVDVDDLIELMYQWLDCCTE